MQRLGLDTEALGEVLAVVGLFNQMNRLADAYRRVGEKAKAEHELGLYKELSKKNSEQAERERHEIQQFVFALRDQRPATPAPQAEHQ